MALTLGMIGAGHMGTLHARNLMADARVHIVGVTDVVPDRAEALAQLCQGRTFPSVEALLDAGVEAVYVCTPNALHTEAVLTALQRHVHVFSEKPWQQPCARPDRSWRRPARVAPAIKWATTAVLHQSILLPSNKFLLVLCRLRRISR